MSLTQEDILFLPPYLLSWPRPPRVPHAINLAQFADLSRRNQEGANTSDPIRRHSSEQGRGGGKKEGRRSTGGRRAASEFNYLQINQRLLECRQISQVNSAAAPGETLKPDRTRYFPSRSLDYGRGWSREWQSVSPLDSVLIRIISCALEKKLILVVPRVFLSR